MGDVTPIYRTRPRLETGRSHPLRKAVGVAPARQFSWASAIVPGTFVAALCIFGALFPWSAFDQLAGREDTVASWTSFRRTVPVKQVSAQFALCLGSVRTTCVVDGDTIWLDGQNIRIADIDAPEVSRSRCPAERNAGLRATARLTAWLNAGAFEVHPNPDGRDEDRYGRKLRVLSRDGASAVDTLVAEGVARRWGGKGKRWC